VSIYYVVTLSTQHQPRFVDKTKAIWYNAFSKIMENIVQKSHKLLRAVAKEVGFEDIKSRKIETIIRRMQKALDQEEDGIAIAAPQIGESFRIFVVSKRVFEIMAAEENPGTDIKEKNIQKEILDRNMKDLIFINPEIVKSSKEQMLVEEGCLSVRWAYGQVKRAKKILVKALDETGKPFTFGGSGLMAQIFQHEIDHLNGILFIDKAKGLREISPTKNKEV